MSNNLSDESRIAIKQSLGIVPTNSNICCGNCFYYYDSICNNYHARTDDIDTCKNFKKDKKFTFFNGGSMSPR